MKFGSNIDKEMDAVQSNLDNYKELLKLERLGPLAMKKRVVKTVKFVTTDVIESKSSLSVSD